MCWHIPCSFPTPIKIIANVSIPKQLAFNRNEKIYHQDVAWMLFSWILTKYLYYIEARKAERP